MGSLVGARLARSNPHFSSEIWMISSWNEHVSAVNKNGLKVEELNLDEAVGHTKIQHVENVKATNSVSEILKDGPVDFVFILAKSPYTKSAAEKAKELCVPGHLTTVITMQNGLGNFETIKEIIHSGTGTSTSAIVVQAVTDQGAMMIAPGFVKHTGNGVTTLAQSQNEEVNTQLLQLFQTAGFEILVNNNLDSVLWGKLVVNAEVARS